MPQQDTTTARPVSPLSTPIVAGRPVLVPVETGAPDLKRRIKSALGWALYRTGLHRALWRDRALIVFFHRVDDRFPGDQNTTTREEFRAYCEFFARYFVVVSLSELLARLRAGEDISRHLVITFDDGYRDNHRAAAPVLRRLQLPACFFVTTGFVEGQIAAWWDAEKGTLSEWMSWDEVRDLRRQGFEVGAHTTTHPDLSQVSGDDAEVEIAGSKRRLEAELGEPVTAFCIPYGGEAHMSAENAERVRAAGFTCAVTTVPRRVAPGGDPFVLGRVGISPWYISPWHLGFEAMLLK